MNDDLLIRVDGIEFDGRHETVKTDGFKIDPDGVRGLILETPAIRRDETPRPMAAGSFVTPGFLSSRSVSIRGKLWSPSVAAQRHQLDRLAGLLISTDVGRLAYWYGGSLRYLDVQRAPDMSPARMMVTGRVCEYSIKLFAPDPRIYGETRLFPGSPIAAYHYGNIEASPVVTVTGVGAYTITGPGGRQFIVSSALSLGETDVVDFRRGWVRRDGDVLIGGVSSAETWTVPPGQTIAMSISGGPSMTVAVTDTWV